jgi:hypothetical protein
VLSLNEICSGNLNVSPQHRFLPYVGMIDQFTDKPACGASDQRDVIIFGAMYRYNLAQ